MNDKSALLGQLKIDRDLQPKQGGAGKWILVGVAVVAALVAAFFVFKPAPAIPVKVATAMAATAAGGSPGSVLDASGYVVARREATVSSKVTGKVVEINIEEGKAVKAGDVLARLDDTNAQAALALALSQLDAAKAAQNEIKAQLIQADHDLRRNQDLHQRGLVSDAALDNARSTDDTLKARMESAAQNVNVAERGVSVQRRYLDDNVVRAPFAGVITVKNAQVGEMISPLSAGGAGTRTGIGTLVDMDSLEIEVDVNENFINRVQAGQKVEGVLNAYPDWRIPCNVIAVIPTADRSKATVKVRIGITVKDPRIIPDMGVRVSFLPEEQTGAAAAEAPKGVLVPGDAIRDDNGTKVVFIVGADNKVERRAIGVGQARGTMTQVLAGLQGGDKVAVGDLSKLSDGAKVEIQQ